MAAQSPFDQKRTNILRSLSLDPANYTDLSRKGSVDEPIRHLINLINRNPDLVTTSSCSGRVSVFLEGSGSVGKGGGGRWLFVSHEPLDLEVEGSWTGRFGMHPPGGKMGVSEDEHMRHVHLKFEPMILHVSCRNANVADRLLKCAQAAGFRESGASNVPGDEVTPVNVAVRTLGLAMDTIVGYSGESERGDEGDDIGWSLVEEQYLARLVRIVNTKFATNFERMERWKQLIDEAFSEKKTSTNWESSDARRHRKRHEGLQRQAAMQDNNENTEVSMTDKDGDVDLQGLANLDEG